MAINKDLLFVKHAKGHENECNICGRKIRKHQAVAAEFHPEESMAYAAVYCFVCIELMADWRTALLKRSSTGGR